MPDFSASYLEILFLYGQGDRGSQGERGMKGARGDMGDPGVPGEMVKYNRK